MWALSLAHLHEMQAWDEWAAGNTALVGRNFEPCRPQRLRFWAGVAPACRRPRTLFGPIARQGETACGSGQVCSRHERWRAVLAVAGWLEKHGVDDFSLRMASLS